MPSKRGLAVVIAVVLLLLAAGVIVAITLGPAEPADDVSPAVRIAVPSERSGERRGADSRSGPGTASDPASREPSGAPVVLAPALPDGLVAADEPWVPEIGLLLAPGNGVLGVGPASGSLLFPTARASWATRETPSAPDASSSAVPDSTSGSPVFRFARHGVRVLDAVTGRAIPDAAILASAYHGDDETLRQAGLPSLRLETGLTDAEGRFALEPLWPEDPRLRLFVQVTHAAFAPVVFALSGREGANGRFGHVIELVDAPDAVSLDPTKIGSQRTDEAVVYLRAVETRAVRLLHGDAPLDHAPVRVHPRRSSSSFLDRAGVVALDHRLVEPSEPFVIFADARGVLRLPFSDWLYGLELLDPLVHWKVPPPAGRGVTTRVVGFVLPVLGEVELPAFSRHRDRRVLVDRDRRVLPSTEIEVTVAGNSVRTITDDRGAFEVDLLPRPPSEPPVSVGHPHAGQVRVLSPELAGWTVDTVFPAVEPRIEIEGAPSPLWTVRAARLESHDGEETPVGVPVRRVVASLDGVLVHCGADGRVAFRGELPEGREALSLVVDDHLPTIVSAPGARRGVRWLDLGDAILSHGWTRRLRIVGATESQLRSASVFLREEIDARGEGSVQSSYRLEVPVNGIVDLRFLYRGDWLVDLEGPFLAPSSGRFTVFEESLDEPVVVDADVVELEDVSVHGSVILGAELASSCRVIEQYWIEGRPEALTMPEYTLDASGVFGSRRQLERVRAVRVSIIARGPKAATAFQKRGEGARFEFGALNLRQPPSAEFLFLANDVGEVEPPRSVALEEQAVRNPRFFLGKADAVRWRVRDGRLRADNLAEGRYALKIGREGAQEAYLFEVANRNGGEVEVRVERPAKLSERVRVAFVDVQGQPISLNSGERSRESIPSGDAPADDLPETSSSAEQRPDEPGGSTLSGTPTTESEPFDVGAFSPLDFREARDSSEPANVLEVTVTQGATTRFGVRPPGFLPVRAEIPPGIALPAEVELFRPQRVKALLRDSAGDPVQGEVQVSWRPLAESRLVHGDPLRVPVRRGRFSADGLPPFPMELTFRLAGSVVAGTLELTLGETDDSQDLGSVQLEERRTLRGTAILFDGLPAARADVALVPKDDAWRYPLVDPIDWSSLSHRTVCEADGSFRFESLPVEIGEDVALVVRRDGHGPAVEWPVDTESASRELVLEPASRLELTVGYRRPEFFDDWVFRLEYQEDEAAHETRRVLGEIPPDLFGARLFDAIRPGRYELTWRLRDAYEPMPALRESVFVPAGGVGSLRLVLEGEAVTGTARLNGRPLDAGWVLLTYDPGVQGGVRVGRVRDGRFTILDPPDDLSVFCALVPEGTPQGRQAIARGEALPILYRGDYRAARRRGVLQIEYRGRDLRIEFAGELLAEHPGARLHHDGYEWNGRRFEVEERSEPVESLNVRFSLLTPKVHTFTLRSTRGTLLRRFTADLREEDQVVRVR